MAFKHGRFAEITISGTNLSQYCDTADLNIDVDTAETSTFGTKWKRHIPGQAGGTIAGAGNYDPTASTGPVVVLTSLIGEDPFAITLHPAGSGSGQIVHTLSGILTSYAESSPVADKVTFTFDILADGEITTEAV